jgi:GNAT superfamily N-acetyltransferase
MKSGMAGPTEINMAVARPSDVMAILALVERYYAFEGIETLAKTRKSALTQLLGDHTLGRVWLIRNQEWLVGYVAVCFGFSIELGGREAFVDEFFMAEGQRGKGIGKQAMQEVIAWLKSQEFVAVHLEVGTANHHAQRLYAGFGFAPRDKYRALSLNLSKMR